MLYRRSLYFIMRFFRHIHDLFVPHSGNGYKPHLFQIEIILAILFLSITVTGCAILRPQLLLGGVHDPAAVIVAMLADSTNKTRVQNSVQPLTIDVRLMNAAQMKADDMAKRGYFSHATPDGKLPWDFFRFADYDYQYAGENLAVNFFDSAVVANAWMNSPTHRANIVNPNFTNIGFGISQGNYEGKPSVFVVEFFGSPVKELNMPVTSSKDSKSAPIRVKRIDVASTTASGNAPTSRAKVLGMVTDGTLIPQTQPTAQEALQKAHSSISTVELLLEVMLTVVSITFCILAGFVYFEKRKEGMFLLLNGICLVAVLVILLWFNHLFLVA